MKINFEEVLKWCQVDAPDRSCEECMCNTEECALNFIEAIKEKYDIEE